MSLDIFTLWIDLTAFHTAEINATTANQSAVFGSHTPIYHEALFTTSGGEESSGKEEENE